MLALQCITVNGITKKCCETDELWRLKSDEYGFINVCYLFKDKTDISCWWMCHVIGSVCACVRVVQDSVIGSYTSSSSSSSSSSVKTDDMTHSSSVLCTRQSVSSQPDTSVAADTNRPCTRAKRAACKYTQTDTHTDTQTDSCVLHTCIVTCIASWYVYV